MNINHFALLAFMILAGSLSACKTAPSTGSTLVGSDAEIRSMLDQYFADFNESRSEDIPAVWHVPGWVASGDRNLLLVDNDAVRSFYRAILDTIEAEGYDHSDLLNVDITFANAVCATIDFTFTRWDMNGEIMPPRVRPVSCVVLKNNGRWGINTLIFNTRSKIYN